MKKSGPPPVGAGVMRVERTPCCDLMASEQVEQHCQLFVDPGAAASELEPEVRVLLRSVSHPEDVSHTSAADDVEDGDVLGQADRLVEGQHDCGQQDG